MNTQECIINKNRECPSAPQEAVYPFAYLKEFNYWVPVRRVDNPFGGLGFVRLRQAQSDF